MNEHEMQMVGEVFVDDLTETLLREASACTLLEHNGDFVTEGVKPIASVPVSIKLFPTMMLTMSSREDPAYRSQVDPQFEAAVTSCLQRFDTWMKWALLERSPDGETLFVQDIKPLLAEKAGFGDRLYIGFGVWEVFAFFLETAPDYWEPSKKHELVQEGFMGSILPHGMPIRTDGIRVEENRVLARNEGFIVPKDLGAFTLRPSKVTTSMQPTGEIAGTFIARARIDLFVKLKDLKVPHFVQERPAKSKKEDAIKTALKGA